jgi:predicted Mrr-cat superfamily restriction endonuclease
MSSVEPSRVLWLVRSGERGEMVDACVANGFAAVRYATVGDVRERKPAKVLEEMKEATHRSAFKTLSDRLLAFATKMREGDFVVTSDGERRQLVVGRVTGPYEWREDSPIPGMRHLRPVEWLGRIDWDDLDDYARSKLVNYPWAILEWSDPRLVALGEGALAGELLPVTPTAPAPPRRPRSHQVRATRPDERLCQVCHLWKNRAQFHGGAAVCQECH